MENKIEKNYIYYSIDDLNQKEIEITDVYVSPEYRGQGIGKKLVLEVIEYARDNGFESVGLYAEPQSEGGLDGDALIEFYRSIGFKSDGDCNNLMQFKL